MKEMADKKQSDGERKKREQRNQQLIDLHRIKVEQIKQDLELKKLQRAIEILHFLRNRGYKKVGKT